MSDLLLPYEPVGKIPTEELMKRALSDLKEDPKCRKNDIAAIQQWLKKEPHLKNAPVDDEDMILLFLRGCKFSLEKTKKKLDNYFTMRGALPEFFRNTDPKQPILQEILKLGIYLPLPNVYDHLGRQVLIMRFGNYDPGKYSPEDLTKISYMIFESAFGHDDQGQIMGFAAVADMRGATLAHMVSFSPTVMKKSMTFFQDASPARPKSFIYIHVPSGFETMFNLFKGFMSQKLQSRLNVLGNNVEALYDQVPKDRLPPDLGGTLPMTYQQLTDYWYERVMSKRDLIIAREKYPDLSYWPKSIRFIHLERNQITQWDPRLNALHGITHLNLEDNELKSTAEISNLRSLQKV
ncbi:unnamed protein product [Notodromas monacha]|uniref:CRAL-TRIO domain-containing protein n=1 Tax=Notodromas monacha TaxID=399045 RepID=A0A7R9BZG5_9CRUS|nr:unnamed protein product [Notodromas monacha]CAG0923179.1 unnamed protein product [Notodromas monacha]